MRTITTEERALLAAPHSNHHLKVEVLGPDDFWRDLTALAGTDWVVSATLDADIDGAAMRGSVAIVREGAEGSISPFMHGSPLNRDAFLNYAPLLNAARRIRLSHAVTEPDVAPIAGDWHLMVEGKIDDLDLGHSPMTITFRDLGAYLLDAGIQVARPYGSEGGTPVEVVMQQIINDNLGSGAVTVVTPESPLWMIRPYSQANGVSVLDATRALALQIGWDLRYEFDEDDNFVLLFREPDREKSESDATFGPDEYIDIPTFQVSDADVRNDGVLTYLDSASGEVRFAFASDAGSIAEFGRRFIGIGEGSTSNIDSATEAQAMIDAAVHDLSQPEATQAHETFLWWPAQRGDLYTFQANDVHYDTDQTLAVVSIQHRWTGKGVARTTFTTRGRVAGAYRAWLSTRNGVFSGAITRGPAPVIGTLGGEGSAFGGGPNREGMVWLPIKFTASTDRILVYTVESATSPVPVPELSESRRAWEVRRLDGDIASAAEWATWVMIATRQGYHRKTIALGLGPDGTQGPTEIREAQAVDVGAGPTAKPDQLTVTTVGDTNRVKFRVGDPAASHFVFRNGAIIAEVPAHLYGAGQFAVVDDSGLDTGIPYTYDACAFRNYQTSELASAGSPPTQPPISDDPDAPEWVEGWPKDAGGIIPAIELKWITDPDTVSLSVESRGSAAALWSPRFGPFTDPALFPSGSAIVSVFSTDGEFRLVATFADGSRTYSAPATVGGASTPLASPQWVGGYPALGNTTGDGTLVEARWTLSDSRATKLEFQMLQPSVGGMLTRWVTLASTMTPSIIASGFLTARVQTVDRCRLRATYPEGSTLSLERSPLP